MQVQFLSIANLFGLLKCQTFCRLKNGGGFEFDFRITWSGRFCVASNSLTLNSAQGVLIETEYF